jgi:hypothetical protein
MKCSRCAFELPESMTVCAPCARAVEGICALTNCFHPVWIETSVPMVDRPVHRFCFEHRNHDRALEDHRPIVEVL